MPETDGFRMMIESVFGSFLWERGNKEGESLMRKVLATETRHLGSEHPTTLVTMTNVAHKLINTDDSKEAEQMLHDVLAIRTRVMGAEHPKTLSGATIYADAMLANGKPDEACIILKQTLATQTCVLGDSHPDTNQTRGSLHTAEAVKSGPTADGGIAFTQHIGSGVYMRTVMHMRAIFEHPE
jgi:hypothetical protein